MVVVMSNIGKGNIASAFLAIPEGGPRQMALLHVAQCLPHDLIMADVEPQSGVLFTRKDTLCWPIIGLSVPPRSPVARSVLALISDKDGVLTYEHEICVDGQPDGSVRSTEIDSACLERLDAQARSGVDSKDVLNASRICNTRELTQWLGSFMAAMPQDVSEAAVLRLEEFSTQKQAR
jgi:hypothetical protein